jgi:uncharacterized protein YbjT (DUF2867 family)
VRAVTRNAGSHKARALSGRGAVVVEANIDHLQTIREALKGACGAYFVTILGPFFAGERIETGRRYGLGPKRGDDGKLAIAFPLGNKKMAGISSDDIGACAYGIFRKGEEMIGKRIGVAGDQLTCEEMASKLGKALGEEVKYNELTPDQFRGFGFPGADDLGNMFQFYRDFDEECNSTRDVSRSKKLNPDLKSFDDWLEVNASKIPLE